MEQNQLQNARNELGVAIKLLNEQIKLFTAAHVTYANAKILEVGNHVLTSFKKMKSDMNAYRAKKILEREEKREEHQTEVNRMMAEKMEEKARHERTKEHADAIKQILKEEERRKTAQRIIQIRYGAIQKTKSVFSKLGSVKKNVLQKINQTRNTFDLKVSNAFQKAKLMGLQVETKVLELANGIKNYPSEKIAQFAAWNYERQQESIKKQEERQTEANRMMAEKMEEKARHERTKEHADAMKAILKEQDRQQREKTFLRFKYGVTQKVKSNFSKLGTVKKNALQNISKLKNTFDIKISNAFEKAKLAGLQIETKALTTANEIKNYTSEQISKFAVWRYDQLQLRNQRKIEKEAEQNKRLAEKLEEKERRKTTKEHTDAMKAILKEQDRQEDLKKQADLQQEIRKQIELMQKAKSEFWNTENQPEFEVKGRSL